MLYITRPLKTIYFWIVAAAALLAVAFVYAPDIKAYFHMPVSDSWELAFYTASYRLLFLVSVAIAAWRFGVKWALVVCFFFGVAIIPVFITGLGIPGSWLEIGVFAVAIVFSLLMGRLGNMRKLLEKTCKELREQSELLRLEVAERNKAEEGLGESFDLLQRALQGAINAAAKMVELRDPSTAGHQQRVAKLAVAIAKEMNLPEETVRYTGMAATVHDIGKIYVPAEILSRTGVLTDLEYQIMQTHVQGGYDILKTIEFPWPVADIVLQHHERLDGSGYPQGLKGEEILLEARILALADTVEAMSTHRPYRPAPGTGEALEEVSKNRGTIYDARAVEACVMLFLEKNFRFE